MTTCQQRPQIGGSKCGRIIILHKFIHTTVDAHIHLLDNNYNFFIRIIQQFFMIGKKLLLGKIWPLKQNHLNYQKLIILQKFLT
jgi:hypothetical protein